MSISTHEFLLCHYAKINKKITKAELSKKYGIKATTVKYIPKRLELEIVEISGLGDK